MLCKDDCKAEILIELAQRGEKIRGGNGVKPACRLIKDEHIRPHYCDRCQIHELLLTSGELRNVFHKKLGQAEIACHLCNGKAHFSLIPAEAFRAEGKLVEHLVGDYLVIRVLKDKAYAPCLLCLCDLAERFTEKQNISFGFAMVGKTCLKPAQERTLSAAARAADKSNLTLGDIHADMPESRCGFIRICKAQIADLKRRHTRASFASKRCGAKQSSANAAVPSAGTPPKPLIIIEG